MLLIYASLVVSLSVNQVLAETCFASCEKATFDGYKTPNPSDCFQYFLCSNGTGQFQMSEEPLNCPSGTYFDESYQLCLAEPTDGSEYCTGLCNPCDMKCEEPGTGIPNAYDCNSYYICLADLTQLENTCPPGYFYDYVNSQCSTDPSTCYDSCDACGTYCTEEGRLPDPKDCTKYYYCKSPGTLGHFSCEDGQIFDVDKNLCIVGEDCKNLCDGGDGPTTLPSTGTTPAPTGPTSVPTEAPTTAEPLF